MLPSSISYDGTAEQSAQNLSRPSTNASLQSPGSDASFWITPAGWNASKLLDLSDTVRAALNEGKELTPAELEDLSFVLGMMIADEMDDAPQSKSQTATQKVDLSIIQHGRLDKLITDMLLAHEEQEVDVKSNGKLAATGLWPETEIALSLQKYWLARFKSEYFSLDKRRCDDLIKGALRDILFSSAMSGGRGVWSPAAAGLSEVERNRHFSPGQWWFSLDFARRDGIVGSSVERLTTGRFGIAALPLLTGWEEELPDGKIEYIRRGGQHDMHYGLLTHVGRKTKVIRGYRLKSAYAPQAGIRYDGLYILASWSLKLCPCTNLYTLRVVLERLPRQKPMKEVLRVPKPSQLDDWTLYEQLEKERIEQREGAVRFMDWETAREKEKSEREFWRHVRELQNEMRQNSKAGGSDVLPQLDT
ncbi:hypothetical protein VP1G_01721 [Cytospora mali]|uniref:YDG domain-containing protein n=1 Tax=Cytospora mali TaxID=578113 RepID=A0A194US20_CYTMA|nr:hypothetical protein VP1G_01721 [Valsa mali var. pyri (nom. inval.)]